MTNRALYLLARDALAGIGLEDPGHEALLLSDRFLGLDRTGLALHGEEEPVPEAEAAFQAALSQRLERRPLQYILGEWEFMGLRLRVGEGVLSPREDTAVLAETLAEKLKALPASVGLDLCAGSGAVALGLLSLLPGLRVTCVELSPEALPYLEENLRRYGNGRADFLPGDLFSPQTAAALPNDLDFIACNPPYIPSGVLPGLQPELHREPKLALDGGDDGLRFYRALVRLWSPKLRRGGLLAVEIGEEQGAAVRELFRAAGLAGIETAHDLAGLERCVIAIKP